MAKAIKDTIIIRDQVGNEGYRLTNKVSDNETFEIHPNFEWVTVPDNAIVDELFVYNGVVTKMVMNHVDYLGNTIVNNNTDPNLPLAPEPVE